MYIWKRMPVILSIIFMMTACNSVKDKTKKAINKSGETVGKGATEFFEGVSEGIDKSLKCEMILSPALTEKGLHTGKFSINDNEAGGRNNLLTVYFIFDKDFNNDISVKVFDQKGLEAGRSTINVTGKAGEAGYFDFAFDKRTYIESKSRITLE